MKISEIIITSNFFEAKYPFMYDDINLTARVDRNSGKQWLVLQKIDMNNQNVLFEDKIECIHTAVLTIPISEYNKSISDEDFLKETVKIRSSEHLKEVNLEIEEKFFALRSWIEGIAQIGFNAITIQTEIENAQKLLTPISHRLFRFVALAHPELITDYLIWVEKQSIYEGKRHDSSFNLNLIQLLHFLIVEAHELKERAGEIYRLYKWNLREMLYIHKDFDNIFSSILDMKPSVKIFLDSRKFNCLLKHPEVKKLPDWNEISKNYSVEYKHERIWVYWNDDFGWSLKLNDLNLQNLELISNLENLSFINVLDLSGNNSIEIINAKNLPKNIKMLTITRNKLRNIIDLQNLIKLDYLNLFYNNISEIEWLQNCNNLKILQLGHNSIVNIEPLTNLVKLEHLNLSRNEILNINSLKNLQNLEILNLTKNRITDIDGLRNLKKLKYLNLAQNKINNLEKYSDIFTEFNQIESLDLSNNNIQIIEPLKNLKNLRTLKLNNNNIEDITPLKELPKLKEIFLEGNFISQDKARKILELDNNKK